MKHFKVPVKIRIENNGIYGYQDVEISALGENEKDAMERLRNNLRLTFNISGEARLIHDFDKPLSETNWTKPYPMEPKPYPMDIDEE